MSEYDQAARYVARYIDVMGSLPWLVGEPIWSAWRWRGWLDTQTVAFPGEPERRCDTVAWFDRPNGDAPPLAVVLEFMTRPRREVLERLTEYALRLRRERPLQRDPIVQFDVIGILVNLTGELPSDEVAAVIPEAPVEGRVIASWGMKPPDTGGLGLSDRLGMRNLATMSARDLLAGVKADKVARAALAWLPLLAGADEAEVAEEWARLAMGETDLRIRADLGGIARVFVELADRKRIWGPVLEGWTVERSQYLDEVRSQYLAEVRAKTMVQASRAAVLRVLRRRLDQEVPAELVEVVQRMEDLPSLEQLLDQVATVDSLAGARRVLGLAEG